MHCDCGFTAEPGTAMVNKCPNCGATHLKFASGERDEVLKFIEERKVS